MNDKEKCLFDLQGYIVVEDVLSPAQVALANEAIDCHAASIQNRPADLSGGRPIWWAGADAASCGRIRSPLSAPGANHSGRC